MGWASNLIRRKRNAFDTKNASDSIGELLPQIPATWDNKTSLDLPRDLALIDIETILPKLSVLAAGGSS